MVELHNPAQHVYRLRLYGYGSVPFGQPALVSNAESCGIVCERSSAREPHAQFEALRPYIVRVPPRHHVVIDDVPYSFRLKSLLERCLDKLLAPGSDTLAVEINSHAHLSGGADYQKGEHAQNVGHELFRAQVWDAPRRQRN